MKKFKKLIPALCMLLVSAVMLGSTTFAWFSMNNTVTATGMQITADTDNTYLLIGGSTEDLNAIRAKTGAAAKTTAITVTSEQSVVKPSAHETLSSSATPDKASSWYTGSGTSHDSTGYVLDNSTKTFLTDGDFSKYVIKRTVRLAVADGSKATGEVKVSLESYVKVGNGEKNQPVTVLIVCGTNYVEYKNNVLVGASNKIVDSVPTDNYVEVDIYVYYDGNNSEVYSNNAANLSGASFGLKFVAEYA